MKRKPKLVVVDDEEMNLKTMVRVFRTDFEMRCALSGPNAMALVEQEEYDGALIDYSMPGMTGVELAVLLRARRPGMVLILVTAHVGVQEIETALAAGLVGAVIHKPWNKAELLACVQRLLEPGAAAHTGP